MTADERDYLLQRIGYALLLAGNYLIGEESGYGGGVPEEIGNGTGAGDPNPTNPDTDDDGPTIIDTDPALGEVGVIANRAPLRSEPTKDISPNLGRLLGGERVPLDAISVDGKWYRVDVRGFAGLHTIPDDATFGWAEADRFEVLSLNENATA